MKFITEEDLRARYQNEHFTSYRLEPGSRLTPGARQYLSDLGIRMPEEEQGFKKRFFTSFTGEKKSSQEETDGKKMEQTDQTGQNKVSDTKESLTQSTSNSVIEDQEWRYTLKSIQARFLETGIDLLSVDVLMVQEIFELERVLSEIGREESEKEKAGLAWEGEKKICRMCSGISPERAGEAMPDCFEVTGFHAQSLKGREIVKLHILRCALREFALHLPDERKRIANQVINRLSQMICQSFGGKICQKN
ncbi:hypothetical protein ADH76_10430 [Enterocloster clostridioformis]|uniref:hypothetical protein n=1 Tax=Enterocloster clostridioformis TaxID=1531 RepID=UPI00080CBC40|nr:hypothetical protein [Enterocloster clostridioformis]ANU48439.1 hypothetical protein A4V08_24170 [Lachnoclostridium sp. YL32]NDO29302.1 hypothetical protein [Enterocloster clostridioformis]OXE68857.1 hypothetical protein ADH76_10430 [Enterocloster clostridioformis]QQR02670.1 hypothetical protein I5Q83_10620 [Enterocloster clostridioformis]